MIEKASMRILQEGDQSIPQILLHSEDLAQDRDFYGVLSPWIWTMDPGFFRKSDKKNAKSLPGGDGLILRLAYPDLPGEPGPMAMVPKDNLEEFFQANLSYGGIQVLLTGPKVLVQEDSVPEPDSQEGDVPTQKPISDDAILQEPETLEEMLYDYRGYLLEPGGRAGVYRHLWVNGLLDEKSLKAARDELAGILASQEESSENSNFNPGIHFLTGELALLDQDWASVRKHWVRELGNFGLSEEDLHPLAANVLASLARVMHSQLSRGNQQEYGLFAVRLNPNCALAYRLLFDITDDFKIAFLSILRLHLLQGEKSQTEQLLEDAADRFSWEYNDIIEDFNQMLDKVDMSQVFPAFLPTEITTHDQGQEKGIGALITRLLGFGAKTPLENTTKKQPKASLKDFIQENHKVLGRYFSLQSKSAAEEEQREAHREALIQDPGKLKLMETLVQDGLLKGEFLDFSSSDEKESLSYLRIVSDQASILLPTLSETSFQLRVTKLPGEQDDTYQVELWDSNYPQMRHWSMGMDSKMWKDFVVKTNRSQRIRILLDGPSFSGRVVGEIFPILLDESLLTGSLAQINDQGLKTAQAKSVYEEARNFLNSHFYTGLALECGRFAQATGDKKMALTYFYTEMESARRISGKMTKSLARIIPLLESCARDDLGIETRRSLLRIAMSLDPGLYEAYESFLELTDDYPTIIALLSRMFWFRPFAPGHREHLRSAAKKYKRSYQQLAQDISQHQLVMNPTKTVLHLIMSDPNTVWGNLRSLIKPLLGPLPGKNPGSEKPEGFGEDLWSYSLAEELFSRYELDYQGERGGAAPSFILFTDAYEQALQQYTGALAKTRTIDLKFLAALKGELKGEDFTLYALKKYPFQLAICFEELEPWLWHSINLGPGQWKKLIKTNRKNKKFQIWIADAQKPKRREKVCDFFPHTLDESGTLGAMESLDIPVFLGEKLQEISPKDWELYAANPKGGDSQVDENPVENSGASELEDEIQWDPGIEESQLDQGPGELDSPAQGEDPLNVQMDSQGDAPEEKE